MKSFEKLKNSEFIKHDYKPLNLALIIKYLLITILILANNLAFMLIYMFLDIKNNVEINKIKVNKLIIKLLVYFPYYLLILFVHFYQFIKEQENLLFNNKKSLKLQLKMKTVIFLTNFSTFFYLKTINLNLYTYSFKISV